MLTLSVPRGQHTTTRTTLGELALAYYEAAFAALKDPVAAARLTQRLLARVRTK